MFKVIIVLWLLVLSFLYLSLLTTLTEIKEKFIDMFGLGGGKNE